MGLNKNYFEVKEILRKNAPNKKVYLEIIVFGRYVDFFPIYRRGSINNKSIFLQMA